ncbi:MAG: DNA-3-methyladenine glycosylase 2 family protein, partial [Acidimicrobiales bacterium]
MSPSTPPELGIALLCLGRSTWMSENRQTLTLPTAILAGMGQHSAGGEVVDREVAGPSEATALDGDLCYRALSARDARFDGWFFVGVTTTRIYCRPSCPSVLPRRDRVRFFRVAAGAQRAGFRACKRCRPDASPGSPEWNRRGDVVGRAVLSILDGVVDREGVAGLARRLGYSSRQLQRLLVAELGAGPVELARAQRAETARILLETTTLKSAEVAFAAGFGSVRQFNDTINTVYGETPTALRHRARRAEQTIARRQRAPVGIPGVSGIPGLSGAPGRVRLRLAYRAPLPLGQVFSFLATRAVPGAEEGDASYYRRSMWLPHGSAVATVRAGDGDSLSCELSLSNLRDLPAAVRRVRHLLDLDSDPAAVVEALGADTVIGAAVTAHPGLRIPGTTDGDELAARAVIGQQVSVAGARTVAARLVAQFGADVAAPVGSVVRHFPTSQVLAGLSPDELPMPQARGRALIGLCELVASGRLHLDPGADRDAVTSSMRSLPGIGAWTVAYVRMRALADPDAFLPSDLGIRRALERLRLPASPKEAADISRAWRPYRAYAAQYL